VVNKHGRIFSLPTNDEFHRGNDCHHGAHQFRVRNFVAVVDRGGPMHAVAEDVEGSYHYGAPLRVVRPKNGSFTDPPSLPITYFM